MRAAVDDMVELKCHGQLHWKIHCISSSMPSNVKSKNAENSTESSSSSPVASSTPVAAAAALPILPVAGSDCDCGDEAPVDDSSQQPSRGLNMKMRQSSTGTKKKTASVADSLQQNEERDDELKILKEICSEIHLSQCEFAKLFVVCCRATTSNSSLRSKSRSLIDVDEGDNKDSEANPPTRETQPSVSVNSDNRNDEQHDDNQKNNERVVGGSVVVGNVESMQNSSLTSKDSATHSNRRATAMMMSIKSSKEFHHNDDEVDCYTSESSSMASLSTTDSSIISRLLLSDTRYEAMIDDSTSAHFTPSSSCASCPSSSIKPTSTVFDGLPRSAAYRVKFNPCWHINVHNTEETSKTNNDPPQMEPLSIVADKEIDSSHRCAFSTLVSAKNLPRLPVRCPLTNCDSCSMPSEFCNHITIDHPSVGISRCAPGEVTNMTINHLQDGTVTCQRMFLVSDRIADIGSGSHQDRLPIVLLSRCDNGFMHIWLVGCYEFPCDYTLSMWQHGRDDAEMTLIKCFSNTVLNMNSSFNPRCVAGSSLTLSPIELSSLCGGDVSCQVVFH